MWITRTRCCRKWSIVRLCCQIVSQPPHTSAAHLVRARVRRRVARSSAIAPSTQRPRNRLLPLRLPLTYCRLLHVRRPLSSCKLKKSHPFSPWSEIHFYSPLKCPKIKLNALHPRRQMHVTQRLSAHSSSRAKLNARSVRESTQNRKQNFSLNFRAFSDRELFYRFQICAESGRVIALGMQ